MSIEDLDEAMRKKREQRQAQPDWAQGLARAISGAAKNTFGNACQVLREHPDIKGRFQYDSFRGCTYVGGALPWNAKGGRAWDGHDDLAATEWMESLESPNPIMLNPRTVSDAVQRIAYERRHHPVLEWLEGLRWDGSERLTTWLPTYLGAEDSTISRAFGRCFLISAVARIQEPGCKADHALLLIGTQGLLKSSALRALMADPSWFTDQISDLGTKDSSQDLPGKWLIEIGELAAFQRSEVERVKAFISRRVDHYRPSYGPRAVDVPRQCVFAASTNDPECLLDDTGGRRFWPVVCGKVRVEAIKRDRDQLWAEAVAAYHAGERWWLTEELEKLATEVQEEHRLRDPWQNIIAVWAGVERDDIDWGHVTPEMILNRAIGKPVDRLTSADGRRIAKALRKLNWVKRTVNGYPSWSKPQGGEGGDKKGGVIREKPIDTPPLYKCRPPFFNPTISTRGYNRYV